VSWLRSFFGVVMTFAMSFVLIAVSGAAVLVQLLRAIWAFEFVAFAGNDQRASGQKEQGKFHRRLQ